MAETKAAMTYSGQVRRLPHRCLNQRGTYPPLSGNFRHIPVHSTFFVGDVVGDELPRENVRRPEKALSPRQVETVTEPGKYFDGQGLFLRVGAAAQVMAGSNQIVSEVAKRRA